MKILLAILTAVSAQVAQASFLDRCELTGKVVEAQRVLSPFHSGKEKHNRDLVLSVQSVKDLGGHTSCDYHIGRDMQLNVESVTVLNLANIQIGDKISVDYFHVNSMTPNGIFESTRVTLLSMAEKALDAAMADSAVLAKMDELIEELSMPERKAEAISVVLQPVPESFCGFAGCTSAYTLMVTIGPKGRNYIKKTLVAKVDVSALGDRVSVQVLQ